MITAAEALERHPQGCWVFDATGHRLDHVFACNPDTGEVIMVDWRPTLWQRLTSTLRRSSRWNWLTLRSHVPTRHGFWPAPLTITPIDPRWRNPREAHDAFMNQTCSRLLEDLL